LAQIAVGGRDDANVDARRAGAADRFELAFLEDAEELGLKLERDISDFIEKHCAAIGQGEAANVRIEGAGESAAFMAEEFIFEKASRHGSTVHFDEIAASTRAEFVDSTGDDFLAGAGLAGDENSGASGRYGLDLRENGAEAAAAAYYRVQKWRLRAVEFAEKRFIRTIQSGGHSLALAISGELCKGS